MPPLALRLAGLLCLSIVFLPDGWSRTGRYRCMWRADPATTMVVGWDQISGNNAIFYFDSRDHGRKIAQYRFSRRADRIVNAKGQSNHFVRLSGLQPDTEYFFVIRDSEGSSERFSFRTAPATPHQRLSIIAGGDSRNFREARRRANLMVAKLRPHFVLFAGDMTGGNSAAEWQDWFDDWQLTVTPQGRLCPIVPARGNHETDNQTLIDLFDLPGTDNYYGLSFGGPLLRVTTLNTNLATNGHQLSWLTDELDRHQHAFWQLAQYHHPMRPHTAGKREGDNHYTDWAQLFFRYGVDLVVECDAHVYKATWPIRPTWEPGHEEGFIRDDQAGTVYIGEGGWGAPLRSANDLKSWTRDAGSFNHVKWIFVDGFRMEVRSLPTDQANEIDALSDANRFTIPRGLRLWPALNGSVIRLQRRPGRESIQAPAGSPGLTTRPLPPSTSLTQLLASRQSDGIQLSWITLQEPQGMIYRIQRRFPGEDRFSTIHSFPGKAGSANPHRYLDQQPEGTAAGAPIEYRINCVLPGGVVKMYTLRYPQGDGTPSGRIPMLKPMDGTRLVRLNFRLEQPSEVTAIVLNQEKKEVLRIAFPRQLPGDHQKTIDLGRLSKGRYSLLVQSGQQFLARYRLAL